MKFFCSYSIRSTLNNAVYEIGELKMIYHLEVGNSEFSNELTNLLSSIFDTTNIDKPHGYLVWMLYDNDMKLIPQGSGAKRVTNPNDLEELIEDEIPIVDNGYLHAYVTNGSAAKISFDNFLVKYIRGKTHNIPNSKSF